MSAEGTEDYTIVYIDPSLQSSADNLDTNHPITPPLSLPSTPTLHPNDTTLSLPTKIKFQLDELPFTPPPLTAVEDDKYSDYFSKPRSNIFSTTPSRLSYGSKERFQFTSQAMQCHLTKRKLITNFCRAFIRFGFPSHRVEAYMDRLAQSLEIEAAFTVLPTNLMIVVFGDQMTHCSETKFLRQKKDGLEMWKLKQTMALGDYLLGGEISIEEASTQLTNILESKPLYYPFIIVLFNGLYAFSSCLIYFRGSWGDGITSLLLGWLAGFLAWVSSEWLGYANLFELTTATLCSIIAASVHGHSCYYATAPAALYPLLPGLTTVLAFVDLIFKNQICGTIKTAKAIATSFVLSFGLMLGTKAYQEILPNLTDAMIGDAICQNSIGNWSYLFVPVMLLSSFVLLHAHPRQFPVMLLTSAVSFSIFELGNRYTLNPELLCIFSAFTVGVIANLYGKLTLDAPLPYLLSGCLIIVQSYFGARGPSAILGELGVFGGTIVIYILVMSLAICVGLFASTLCLHWYRRHDASLCSL